jgi:ribosomal protein S18 acetylase RimI-like enzyme
MSDRLVKLYNLPEPAPYLKKLAAEGITVRRARAYEKFLVVEWVRKTFDLAWAGECDVAFSNQPVSCFIATQRGSILGFACYDSTFKNFFGPMGIAEEYRRRRIGSALLLECLHSISANGYAYAVIGAAGRAEEFYSQVIDSIEIKGSYPGVYTDRLKDI